MMLTLNPMNFAAKTRKKLAAALVPQELRTDYDRLSDYLNYRSYDDGRRVYFNDDNSVGFLLELPPVMFVNENIINTLTSALEQSWPKDSIVQIMIYADPNMEPMINHFEALRKAALIQQTKREQFLSGWAKGTADFYRKHREHGLSEDAPTPFRNFRVFVACKCPIGLEEVGKDRSKVVDKLQGLRDTLVGGFKTNGIIAREVGPDILIQFLWQVLNPNHEFLSRNMYDEGREIRHQVVAADTRSRAYWKNLKLDDTHFEVLTPQVMPQKLNSYRVNSLIGDIMGGNLRQIASPFLLTLNIDVNPVEGEIYTKSEVTGWQQAAAKAIAQKLSRKNQEFARAASMLEDGKKFLRGYQTLVIYDRNKKRLDRSMSMAITIWENEGYRLQREWGAPLPFFLASLPFGLNRDALDNRFGRMSTAPANSFAILAPLQGDWRGTGRPSHLFLTRRAQICGLCLRNSDTNYNARVAASSGSGKSFFLNKLITDNASLNGMTFIIDVGKSYKKLNSLMDGQYIEFERKNQLSANVFSMISSEMFREEGKVDVDEKTSLLTMCTRLLAQMANATEKISDTDQRILANVINEAYAALQPGEYMVVDRFVEILDRMQADCDQADKQYHAYGQLAERLRIFCHAGEYGKWFQGKMNIEFNKKFVVLELEQLNGMPDLREVILLMLIAIVERTMYFGDRTIPKFFVIDEAWDLFRGANTGAFIETAYRRFRKYNGSIITITQSLNDFHREGNKDVGMAIKSNSEFTFLLQPDKAELKQAVDDNLISLSEAQLKFAETVRTVKGSYSEIMIVTSRSFGVVRFVPTPQELVAYTTDPDQVAIYEAIYDGIVGENKVSISRTMDVIYMCMWAFDLHKQGMSPRGAIQAVLDDPEKALAYGKNKAA